MAAAPNAHPLGEGLDEDAALGFILEEARRRRIDLRRVSISALVDRSLARLADILSTEKKADAFVIAATLTEMKSRLLLADDEAERSDEEASLRRRLERLAAARDGARALMAKPRLGIDVWPRGAPETETTPVAGSVDLIDIVRAYARLNLGNDPRAPLDVRRAFAMSIREGLEALEDALPHDGGWTDLAAAMAEAATRGTAIPRRSAIASGFAAALELARTGAAEIRQDEARETVNVRRL